MTVRTIEIKMVYDDSGECYYILPSGFADTVIVVNESPVDLEVRHMSIEEANKTFADIN
jgi:hypothetical protein